MQFCFVYSVSGSTAPKSDPPINSGLMLAAGFDMIFVDLLPLPE